MVGDTNQIWDIDISNAGIEDMVPKWFLANLAFRKWISMNISYKNFYGIIPNLTDGFVYLEREGKCSDLFQEVQHICT